MQNEELIDITELFDRLLKSITKFYKVCLVIIAVSVVLMEVKTLFTYNPTYTSSMTVIISQSESGILVTSETTEKINASFRKVLTSAAMQDIIKEDLGLNYLPASLSASIVYETNFMLVSATSSNPKDAYNVIMSIVENYGQLTKLMNNANIIIIDEPVVPSSPDYRPSYIKEAIKGMIVGILLSGVVVCGYAFSRRTITRSQHIKKKLHLKYLGSIPEYTNKKRTYQYKDRLLVTNKKITAEFSSSFRSLILNIERKKDKVYMIASTLPNEGKSTVSSNIALSLANVGNKVVLVDLDLRNPSLNHMFNVTQNKEQIGDYLEGKFSMEHIITPSDQSPNLDLILGTTSYNHSIEMLNREQLSKLITELKKAYDYVILDVPPLLLMQDALIIAKHVDSTLLVIRQDYAKIYEVIDAVAELYEVNKHISGCVLNQVKKSFFDEETKGYGYGYGYGYGSKN